MDFTYTVLQPLVGFAEESSSKIAPDIVDAVKALVVRTVGPDTATSFELRSISNADTGADTFELESRPAPAGKKGHTVIVSGSSGPALSAAFYHYLRFGCNSSVSWGAGRSGVAVNIGSDSEMVVVVAGRQSSVPEGTYL